MIRSMTFTSTWPKFFFDIVLSSSLSLSLSLSLMNISSILNKKNSYTQGFFIPNYIYFHVYKNASGRDVMSTNALTFQTLNDTYHYSCHWRRHRYETSNCVTDNKFWFFKKWFIRFQMMFQYCGINWYSLYL